MAEINLSMAAQNALPSGVRRMFELAKRYPDAINLTLGEPGFATPDHIIEAGIRGLREGKTKYTPNAGIRELREAIADKLWRENGIKCDPEKNLIVTAGATQALMLAMVTLVNPGDEVIIQVAAIPDASWNIPALQTALTGEFVFPAGTQMNPEVLTSVAQINVSIAAGNNQGLLITSKHENSTSYNQSLEYVARQETPATLVIIVDAISRKYYTAETSWLWDISFEMLKNSNLKQIILSGKYAYDLALRFEYVELGNIPVVTEPDLDKMAQMIRELNDTKLYCVTCFSDKDKLLRNCAHE